MNTYHKMNTLKAFISNKDIFMYIPNETPKIAPIDKNQMHFDILSKCETISKEEFEKDLNVNTFEYSLFKTMYLAELKHIDEQPEQDLASIADSQYNPEQ